MAGVEMTQVVENDLFIARRIPDTFAWAVGEIGADADQSDEAQVALVEAVLNNTVRVASAEEAAAICNDGRRPDALANGEPVPVRPMLLGASLVAGHNALEAVGEVPYTRSADEAVLWSAHTMQDAKLIPVAHLGCAAGASYVTVKENGVRWADEKAFVARQQQTMGVNGVPYDPRIQAIVNATHRRQLRRPERYDDLTLDTFTAVAQHVTGDRGVVSYVDDGRGVNGHVEEAAIRAYTPGYAIDGRALNESGHQVLAQNDDAAANMAKRLAFALRKLHLEIPLRHALNTQVNAGHGTLFVPGTPTWLVKKKNGCR